MIVECPRCHRKISSRAASCPFCAASDAEKKETRLPEAGRARGPRRHASEATRVLLASLTRCPGCALPRLPLGACPHCGLVIEAERKEPGWLSDLWDRLPVRLGRFVAGSLLLLVALASLFDSPSAPSHEPGATYVEKTYRRGSLVGSRTVSGSTLNTEEDLYKFGGVLLIGGLGLFLVLSSRRNSSNLPPHGGR